MFNSVTSKKNQAMSKLILGYDHKPKHFDNIKMITHSVPPITVREERKRKMSKGNGKERGILKL